MADVVRTAPDGARVSVQIPTAAGALKWHGSTRFTGTDFARDFTIAPAGAHRAITGRILPDARTRTVRRSGFDLMVIEAGDRSDSALVVAGPYHEAHTWFGGPAPRASVLTRIVSKLDFADSPDGARLTGRSGAHLQQYGVMLVASEPRMTVMIMDARQERDRVPAWRGLARGDAEVWRFRMDLREDEAARLAGTPLEWRYLFANRTTVFEVAFRDRPPRGAGPDVSVDEDFVNGVLDGLTVDWAA
ncbi:hypothetical protein AB0M28_06265 [Streptomyces sp. NPDC051940]|uniref:hypothetical protein n=1 Tax=Streptomyces sp. NPDC051940 TaxID=3155675 RepID=UPI003437FC1F